jgi:hypothetical protein
MVEHYNPITPYGVDANMLMPLQLKHSFFIVHNHNPKNDISLING